MFYKKFIYSDDCANLAEFWAKVQGGLDAGREVPIEQFTGLTDKHGKEIYEGDVVRFSFKSGSPTYLCEWSQRDRGFLFSTWFMNDEDVAKCEVIGNIYENKDLLSEGKEKI